MVQGIYWLGTLPEDAFVPICPLPIRVQYLRGQLEIGHNTGFRHWQLLLVLSSKQRLSFVTATFPGGHWELSRSSAATDYVWKEETRVEGTQFEFGIRKLKRNSSTDWDTVRTLAKTGNFDDIPSDIFIRCYHQLRSISNDAAFPIPIVRTSVLYWGKSGTGKTRRAFEEAGALCYFKDPRTKWWCGYRGEEHVIFDEFRGTVL